MKKKVLAIVFVIALVITSLLALAACNDDNNGNFGLVYEKKYIYETYVHYPEDNQRYFVFHKSGYCEYHYNSEYDEHNWQYNEDHSDTVMVKIGTVKKHYTVEYRYTYVDDDKSAIVFFYNGVKDDSTFVDTKGNTTPLKESDWYKNKGSEYLPSKSVSELFTVSKNVLCTAGTYGYSFYINEDYVKNIPNFNPHNASED